ncbi:MAG: hypothetical protein NTU93_04840 [Arthrobacter sp.]|nr:hypothetical protein [Arthrobacter sp.]
MFSFFGLAMLAAIIMFGIRRYKASSRGRTGNGPGSFPGQPIGGSGGFPGQQDNQPRDGFTQRDYYGGFGQLGAPQPPAKEQYQVPYEDSPDYLRNPPQAGPQAPAWQPPAQPQPPAAPPVPTPSSSEPQGYRARKLAELDQKYSNGELAMEDYMAQRAEIMKG